MPVSIIDPSQDPRWDKFVEAHPYGLISHISGWKRVLEGAFHHMRGYCLALSDTDGGAIRAGLPLYLVKSPITGTRLVSVPFSSLGDPLATDPRDMAELLDAAVDLASRLNASRIEIRTLASACLVDDPRYGRRESFKSHELQLNDTPEQLLKRFHRTSVLAVLKRCWKIGLQLHLPEADTGLSRFYQFHVAIRKRLGLPPQPYRFFLLLSREFIPGGRMRILEARYGQKPIASMILFRFRDRVSWEFIGENQAFRGMNGTHFLLWEAIRQAHAEGFKVFDFGRTASGHTGLMVFKNRWGTEVVDLPQFHFPADRDSTVVNREQSLPYRCIQGLVRKTPDRFLPLLGELCYRHMG